MEQSEYVQRLEATFGLLDHLPMDSVFRPQLGRRALTDPFGKRWEEITKLRRLAASYAKSAPAIVISNAITIFEQIHRETQALAGMQDADFVSNTGGFLANIDKLLQEAREWEMQLLFIGIKEAGLLDFEVLREKQEALLRSLDERAEQKREELRKVVDEGTQIVNQARESASQATREYEERLHRKLDEAAQREAAAIRTARQISVKAAQDQFERAQQDLEKKVGLWMRVSSLTLVLLAVVVLWFSTLTLPREGGWHAAYHTALRLAVLSGVAGLTAASWKILRSYLHLRERNLHRQRVANSIDALVAAAYGREAQDAILAHLVHAVTEFGISGLIAHEAETGTGGSSPGDLVARLNRELASQ